MDAENGPYRVTFRINHEPSPRTIVRQVTILTPAKLRRVLEDSLVDWAGVDRDAIAKELLHELLADAWQEAGGHDLPVHALPGHIRDDNFCDLGRGRAADPCRFDG